MVDVIDQIVKEVSDKFIEFQIKTNLAVPSRSHQIKYSEYQNLYGINKRLSFYNNSSNDYYAFKCNLRNDFYGKSEIIFELRKTKIDLHGLKFHTHDQVLFEGGCEDANEVFIKLKNNFYDKHLKIPVPPMR